jgi:NADPH:quinone reductase-like Zn-dependent oxidoreductase
MPTIETRRPVFGNGEQLQKIADLMAAGKVKSIIGEVFPFSRQGISKKWVLSRNDLGPTFSILR